MKRKIWLLCLTMAASLAVAAIHAVAMAEADPRGNSSRIAQAAANRVAATTEDSACIPDPAAFFGVQPNESGSSDGEIWMTYAFETEEDCSRAFEEYAALLKDSRFSLKLVNTSKKAYRYDYVGTKKVGKLNDRLWKGDDVIVLYNYSNAGKAVQITVSDDLELKDTGDRPEKAYKVKAPKNSPSVGGTTYEWDKPDCSVCSGSGRCRACGGSGHVTKWVVGTFEYVDQTCTTCMGMGQCYQCGGSGKY
ncbi:MAG: hypothetical protein Q4G52_06580 [Clostridia bacterium]|nr:hypothetical protein [Clostridia bacterium]